MLFLFNERGRILVEELQGLLGKTKKTAEVPDSFRRQEPHINDS
jgi:hypothetical protein